MGNGIVNPRAREKLSEDEKRRTEGQRERQEWEDFQKMEKLWAKFLILFKDEGICVDIYIFG